MESLIRNPIVANVLDMMGSFSLLLALSSAYAQPMSGAYDVLLFIGLCSLTISSTSIALLATGLHTRVAQLHLFQVFSPFGEIHWKHLQFVSSLSLCSFNWIGFLLNISIASSIPVHQAYAASFFSLVLCLSFLLTALISLYDMSDQETMDRKAHLIQKQQQKPHQYAEL